MGISSTIYTTVIFLFFLLPGIIFTQTFWRSERGYLQSTNFYQYLLRGLLASTILYLIFYKVYNWQFLQNLFGYQEFNFLSSLTAMQVQYGSEHNVVKIVPYCKDLLFFSLFCDLFAYCAGKFCRFVIMLFRMDLFFCSLRFKSDWYYILRKRTLGKSKYSHVICLMEVGKSVVVYTGVLVDYILKDAQLEYITLKLVRRSGITDWEPSDLQYPEKSIVPVHPGDASKQKKDIELLSIGNIDYNGKKFSIEIDKSIFHKEKVYKDYDLKKINNIATDHRIDANIVTFKVSDFLNFGVKFTSLEDLTNIVVDNSNGQQTAAGQETPPQAGSPPGKFKRIILSLNNSFRKITSPKKEKEK